MENAIRVWKTCVSGVTGAALVAVSLLAVAQQIGAQAPSLRAVGPVDPNTGFPTGTGCDRFPVGALRGHQW